MKFNKGKVVILIVTVLVVLIVDQVTKHFVHTNFHWGETRQVLPAVFSLTYVRNQGAAFGMLHKAPAKFREPFFMMVPIIALIIIMTLFVRLKENQRWTAFSFSLIVGGAIGNLIDRIRYGFVVDFLDFHWKEIYHWPAFNVADSAIVVGVGILFVISLFDKKKIK